MGGDYTSTGCPVTETLPHDPTRFLGGGDLNWQLHNTGWLVCGCLTVLATSTSIWHISRHLSYFYHPKEQRHVVRLLFMPIVYSTCSFGSYYFTRHAIYWQLVRDCYEAVVIGSFFFLLTSFLSNPPPTLEMPHPQPHTTRFERAAQLRLAVKDVHLKKWMWPLGKWKWRPAGGGPGEGEAFLWWMRVCIGQYILVRPLSTLAAVIGEALGYYCLASWSPRFIHVWTSIAITVSVTIAMYCVLQLYMPLKDVLAPHRPVLKFLCVKLVVFFMFWQESLLSFFPTFGIIKHSAYWTAEDVTIGLAALLACFEMVIFSVLHIKAFPYQPYRALAPADGTAGSRQRSTYRKTRRLRALLTVVNLADFGREIVEEVRFLCRGGRPGDELLAERRRDDFQAVMGQSRPRLKARTSDAQEELEKLDLRAAQQHLSAPDALHYNALDTSDRSSFAWSIPEPPAVGTLASSPPGHASTDSVTSAARVTLPRFITSFIQRLRPNSSIARGHGAQRTESEESVETIPSFPSRHLPHITFRPASYQRISFGGVPSPPPFALCRPEFYTCSPQLDSHRPFLPQPRQFGRPLPPGAALPFLH